VVYPTGIEIPERWESDLGIAMGMMEEAGITIREA
jgi:hypothetical protein